MEKKLLTVFTALIISSGLFAQSLSLSWIGGPIPNGSSITVVGDTSETVIAYVNCKNISSSSIPVWVRKKEISVVPGSQNYFCWTACYLPNIITSTAAIDIGPDTTCTAFSGDYKSRGNIGISTVMYTFFNEFDPNDSVAVVVNFDCSMSSVESVPAEKVVFSRAFPNPANDKTQFSYSLPQNNLEIARLLVRDMLGNIIEDILIPERSGTLTLMTDKYNNGVFFYSLVMGGKIILTKKLIVQH